MSVLKNFFYDGLHMPGQSIVRFLQMVVCRLVIIDDILYALTIQKFCTCMIVFCMICTIINYAT